MKIKFFVNFFNLYYVVFTGFEQKRDFREL